MYLLSGRCDKQFTSTDYEPAGISCLICEVCSDLNRGERRLVQVKTSSCFTTGRVTILVKEAEDSSRTNAPWRASQRRPQIETALEMCVCALLFDFGDAYSLLSLCNLIDFVWWESSAQSSTKSMYFGSYVVVFCRSGTVTSAPSDSVWRFPHPDTAFAYLFFSHTQFRFR